MMMMIPANPVMKIKQQQKYAQTRSAQVCATVKGLKTCPLQLLVNAKHLSMSERIGELGIGLPVLIS